MTARARPLVLVLSNPLDDRKLHVTLLRLALMQRGYAVIVVHSIEGGHTMLRERAVDALLVTLELSVGADLVRDLGAARPSTTIAFAPSGEDGVARALAAGFDLALTLPIDFAELDASLRDRLKSHVSGTRARVRTRRKAGVA